MDKSKPYNYQIKRATAAFKVVGKTFWHLLVEGRMKNKGGILYITAHENS